MLLTTKDKKELLEVIKELSDNQNKLIDLIEIQRRAITQLQESVITLHEYARMKEGISLSKS